MTEPLFQLSSRAARIRPSMIRELMKLADRPGLIALGGGLPSPDSFPVDAIRQAADRVLADSGRAALQYASTEGFPPLREWIADRLGQRGMDVDPARVLITSGSQQGLDLVGRLLLDESARIAVEAPTYLGALQAFAPSGAEAFEIACDDDGPLPDALPTRGEARALYLLPNFQNPSGRCIGAERRRAIADEARRRSLPLIEDDPYGDLWFDVPPPPPLAASWPEGTVYLGSFSKVLAPGLRLGYLVSPPELHERFVQAKQGIDLHTGILSQRIVHEVLATGLLEAHLDGVRERYRANRDAMRDALELHLSHRAHWVAPEGGMFFWLELPDGVDAMPLLTAAVERGVAFVPGAPFFASRPRANTLRLSFVTETPARIAQGIAILAELIGDRAS